MWSCFKLFMESKMLGSSQDADLQATRRDTTAHSVQRVAKKGRQQASSQPKSTTEDVPPSPSTSVAEDSTIQELAKTAREQAEETRKQQEEAALNTSGVTIDGKRVEIFSPASAAETPMIPGVEQAQNQQGSAFVGTPDKLPETPFHPTNDDVNVFQQRLDSVQERLKATVTHTKEDRLSPVTQTAVEPEVSVVNQPEVPVVKNDPLALRHQAEEALEDNYHQSEITQLAFTEKLVLKKLGLAANSSPTPREMLVSYADGNKYSSRRSHREQVREILDNADFDSFSTEQIAEEIAKPFITDNDSTVVATSVNTLDPNGTLALMLRYFDAKAELEYQQAVQSNADIIIEPDSADKEAFYKFLRRKAFNAAVNKLDLKPEELRGLTEKQLVEKLIRAYTTPASFLTRAFSNRHHAAMLNQILAAEHNDADDYYTAIRDKIITDGIDINPQGTLAMLLNGLDYLAKYDMPGELMQSDTELVRTTEMNVM